MNYLTNFSIPYGFYTKRTSNSLSEEDHAINSTANALFILEQHLHEKSEEIINIKLDDTSIVLDETTDAEYRRYVGGERSEQPGFAYLDGKGGFKKVFGLEDGRAICIPNLDVVAFKTPKDARDWAKIWTRAVREEKTVADRVIAAGLEAQHITIHQLNVNGYLLPIMIMPRFRKLLESGMQVRDTKNPESCLGSSMFFGIPENLKDLKRLRFIMQGLIDDAAIAMANGLSFGGDACSLVIKDTPNTPLHDRNSLDLFDARNQQIRFFFFDFSSKHGPRGNEKLELLDKNGNPDPKKIREHAKHYVDTTIGVVVAGMLKEEVKLIKDTLGSKTYDACKLIKDSLIEDLTKKTVDTIAKMKLEERLEKLQCSEQEQSPNRRPSRFINLIDVILSLLCCGYCGKRN